MRNVLKYLFVVIIGCGVSEAILSGGLSQPADQTNSTDKPIVNNNNNKVNDSFKFNETTTAQAIEQTTNNNTFYYEADTFLLNKKDQQQKQQQQQIHSSSSSSNEKEKGKKKLPEANVEPASMSSTSGRSGRMLDIDALVGDFAASQLVKARSQTGNRQSRFLPSNSKTLEIGNGKKLHIQGFIPIVGVRDITGDETSGGTSDQDQHDQLQQHQQQFSPYNNNNNNIKEELPYAQSSIGHASFVSPSYQQVDAKFSGAGVVDTLKKPLKKLMRYGEATQQQQQQQQQQHQQNGNIQRQQSNCLCVPFYMCKNGFVSESSLTGSQIQQMIMSQQQQQQQQQQLQAVYPNNYASLQAQSKMSQQMIGSAVAPKAAIDSQAQTMPSNHHQAQFATLSAQVDERSLDRDIITMAPMMTANNDERQTTGNNNNQTSDIIEPAQAPTSLAPDNAEGDEAINATSELSAQANDYSQEILGRMLGIKSTMLGGQKLSVSADSTGGVCGLLRTCCNIPAHLIPARTSQQQESYLNTNEPMMAAQNQMSFSSSSGSSSSSIHPVVNSNRYQTNRHNTNQITDITIPSQQQQQQQQQQQLPLRPTNALLQRGSPYGFPSVQISRMQPLNSPNQLSLMSTALAHRSNMFPQSFPVAATNRFQAITGGQPGDHERAPQQLQLHLPSMQQQQQQQQQQQNHQHLPASSASSSPSSSQLMSLSQHAMISANVDQQQQLNANRMATMGPSISSYYNQNNQQSSNELLGTRKILEGRCGLRQSAGINGRVQNLQYQENAADFGEYPAQAAILKRLTGTDSMFVCGGTLISQYWIATAAHCIKKHSISDLKIRLGEWDVHRDDEFYPYIEKGIRDLVVHSEFVSGNLVNDIALLRLDSPVDATLPHVNPACLPTVDENFTGQKCWVTGWGKDSFGQKGSFQTVLQEVELPIVGQAECESALKQTRLGPHYRLHSGFICAGGERGKDACEGDGGSGLYCMQDGLIKVAGLVSWGIGCGQSGVPGVYVNLAHYRPWIENIISIDEDIYSRNSNTTIETTTTTATTDKIATPNV